jgi:hypothetical protein
VANDGEINIGTKVDTKGLDKGLGEVKGKLGEGSKSAAGFSGGLLKMAGAAGAAAVAVKVIAKAVGEVTDAYKVQKQAETQLEQASRNNPFLSSQSVTALKAYASELQSIGTIGDEELLGFMAQLAAAGRTQEEISKIMKVSLDIAASGTMSMDSAVKSLNKSYGGMAGELGEAVPAVRALTAEQLKQGGAVEILGERYKGMAEEVAKATGTSQQLKNAWGDLKEEIGAPFEVALAPMRSFFTELFSKTAEYKKQQREIADAEKKLASGDTSSDTFKKLSDEANKKLDSLKDELETYKSLRTLNERALLDQWGMTKKTLEMTIKDADARVYTQTVLAMKLKDQLSTATRIEQEKQKALKATEETQKKEAEIVDRNKQAADYIAANTSAREKALEALRLEAELSGVPVDNAKVLDIYAKSYVSLITESNGLVTEQNSAATSLLKTTKKYVEEQAKLNKNIKDSKELEKDLADLAQAFGEVQEEATGSEMLAKQIANLDYYYTQVRNSALMNREELEAIDREYIEKRKKLEKDLTKVQQEEQQKQVQHTIETAISFVQSYHDIVSGFNKIGAKNIEAETNLRMAQAQKEYNDGLISFEEFESKKTEIEKKAAQKKYEMDMWQWSADILMATANTALAASKALSEGGAYAGPVLMALALAAGGIQIGAIIASKPQPPAFATGGIVGGTSYTGDKVLARLDSAEMILNNRQQRNLFDAVNSGSLGGGGTNIQVINSAANDVSAKPVITEDGVRIMIRKTVAKDMKDGRFDSSYRSMRSGLSGTRLTT